MISVKTIYEPVVQVKDKTRIDISKSFITGTTATITTYEIDPDGVTGFIDVTNDQYLDWAFSTSGETTVTSRVTDSDLNISLDVVTITVKTEAEDNLFSNDQDIIQYEPDILNWVEQGRNSFLNKHRTAQIDILDELYRYGIVKNDGTKYDASDIIDIKEFRDYSKFLTLSLIFEGLSNASDDVFRDKANKYLGKATSAKNKAYIKLDRDGDGELSTFETEPIFSGYLRRE